MSFHDVLRLTDAYNPAAKRKGLLTSRAGVFVVKQVILGLLGVIAFAGVPSFSGQLAAADVEILDTFGTNNVAVRDQVAFAAAGTQGVVIVDLATFMVVDVVAPPAGSGSIDDVSIDGDLLFVLDGVTGGTLAVFSIENPLEPTLVSGPVSVAVGPFAGVSAANGRVVVSGGTGLLSVRSYESDGSLGSTATSIDLGVGQPDVLIADDGQTAFVSTDFAGTVNGASFGITVIDLSATPGSISIIDRVGILGAGFTPGADSPANFPIESALQGDTLFVATGNGVSVFDVSNPGSVQSVAQIPLAANPINVDVVDDTLFVVSNSPAALNVIDVSDLNAPLIESTDLPAGAGPLGVAATSTSVVIADEFLGVLVDRRFVLGDVNGDGSVNLLDVGPFVDILGEGDFSPAADINGDGAVNLLDVSGFVALLAG